MAQELSEPQITQDQFDIWLTSPVTVAYLKCLEYKRLDTQDAAGSGRLVDSSNADLTHAIMHRALGQQDAYRAAYIPWDLLTFYQMVFIPEPKEENDE
ncbi:MAG: hypothetical protein ACR2PR_06900 [Pseudohongiellaceae bacterium]